MMKAADIKVDMSSIQKELFAGGSFIFILFFGGVKNIFMIWSGGCWSPGEFRNATGDTAGVDLFVGG